MAPHPPAHLSQGREAEAAARAHLEHAGLTLVTANYRSPFGEIDLIMQDGATLVFVEVRYRNTERFGTPAETVNARKQAKLRATAEHYRQRHKRDSKKPCRFDIVAISEDGSDSRWQWLRNAF
jgi:putative endonuclease